MRNHKLFASLLAVLMIVVFCLPMSFAVSYDKVASSSDMTTVEEVGVEGMEAIGPADVENGTYDVEMESSSSMFKIAKASLTVTDNAMSVAMTLNSSSYPYLYAGTAKEAAALNDVTKYIAPEEDADGNYVFTVPINALDEGFACAAFSKNKEQWYDRTLLVRADSLPEGAVKVELPDYEALEKAAQEKRIEAAKEDSSEKTVEDLAMATNRKNGTYYIDVSMTGGTGKASIESPTNLIVQEGKCYAAIIWSSNKYDYMIVDGVKIEPYRTDEENSAFQIPITKMDEPMKVIADTTAMSVPHEIEYELTFDSSSIHSNTKLFWILTVVLVVVCAIGAYVVWRFWKA